MKMCAKLNNNVTVHRLAADLRLKPSESPVQAVLAYCRRRVAKFIKEFHGNCSTVAELLELSANKLDTQIIEIGSDLELQELQARYRNRGELMFATLDQELCRPGDYGITLKLTNRELWELPYVSIIDSRGPKRQSRYHTKWHEIGHLLILTDQSRLAFHRSHDSSQPKSAEESLVDSIAGEMSFYPELITPHLNGTISFAKIEELRQRLCPDASLYSAILNLSKLWPSPCVWVEARLAAKKCEETTQESFAFREPPERSLRAVHTAANNPARERGVNIIPRFRVPKSSIISQVFEQRLPFGEACEDLAWWQSSDGTKLNACGVHVQAKRIGESVHALVVPSV
jgi:hypothetical protein